MNPSQTVAHAIRFLRDVHRDVAALIESLDQEAQARGWERTLRNRISDDLGNGLSPESWIIKSVWRLYVPKARLTAENPRAALGFVICFEPEQHDHAVAVAVAAKLAGNLSADALWSAWKDARPLLRYLSEHPNGGALPADVLQDGFIAGASDGVAYVAPLMELESMDIVRSRLWDPAFAAVSGQ